MSRYGAGHRHHEVKQIHPHTVSGGKFHHQRRPLRRQDPASNRKVSRRRDGVFLVRGAGRRGHRERCPALSTEAWSKPPQPPCPKPLLCQPCRQSLPCPKPQPSPCPRFPPRVPPRPLNRPRHHRGLPRQRTKREPKKSRSNRRTGRKERRPPQTGGNHAAGPSKALVPSVLGLPFLNAGSLSRRKKHQSSAASAARRGAGGGVGRREVRSTKTWTKWPRAAQGSSGWAKMPTS